MSDIVINEAQKAYSSVELTRNAKGAYQWTVKVYAEAGDEDVALAVARDLDAGLRQIYCPEILIEVDEPDPRLDADEQAVLESFK